MSHEPFARRPAFVALAGLLSLAVAMGIGRFAFTPLLPLMIQGGELDLAAAGWVAAANYAGYLAGAVSAPRIRWSAVRLSAVALAATLLLTAAMAPPLGALAWAVLRFVAGVCSAWAFVGTAVWCLARLAAAQRADLAGVVYAGVGVGIAAAGLHAWVAAAAGASAASLWVQLAGLAAALALPVAVAMRGPVPARAAPQPASAPGSALPPGTRGLIVCYGMLGFGYILPATFLPVLARDVVPDPRVFGLAWPVFGATAAVSTLVAGWLLRRVGRLPLWAVSNVVMGVGVLLPSLWLNGFTIVVSALAVGGTFMIVTMVGVQEMRARAVGDPTRLVGRTTASFALGQIAGPIASSLLLHVPALRTSGLAVALQLAAASLLLAAAWLWRAARQSHPCPEMHHAR